MERVFTVADDDKLIQMISNTKSKLIYIAPGITAKVAAAIPIKIMAGVSATFILDVDSEVCRLGFGDLEGLEILRSIANKYEVPIQHQPGLRIGILISDDDTLIFSPPALLVEAGSMQPDKPNAIMLANTNLKQVEIACGSDESSIPGKSEIGSASINDNKIDEVKKNLQLNPPKPFNISRIERVFSSKIQFVEFKLEHYQLSKMVAPIPSDLLGIDDDINLRDRWKNSFKVLDNLNSLKCKMPKIDNDGNEIEGEVDYNEKSINDEKKAIIKDYLSLIPQYGDIIARSRRAAFDARIKKFKHRLDEYSKKVGKLIQSEIDAGTDKLGDQLFLLIKNNPPVRFKKWGDSEGDIKSALLMDLRSRFKSKVPTYAPDLRVRYKDVTYETIHNDDFRGSIVKLKLPMELKEIFTEYDAAREIE